VGTLTQYYRTTTMVKKDTAEMRRSGFGACITQSNAAILGSVYSRPIASTPPANNWRPVTFAKGFSRGGVEPISVPGVTGPVYLVTVLVTSGHYETTLAGLVTKWPQEKLFMANLVDTLLARMTSTTSASV
jgi:hypothetical protein